jgi:hypothetical protein
MTQRQLRLGAILSGVGTTRHAWRAPDLPGDASVASNTGHACSTKPPAAGRR